VDPNYIAIVAYLVARYLSERVLRLGRQSLSAEEKIRLIDSAASVRSLYLLPAALGMLVLIAGTQLWPESLLTVLAAAAIVFLGTQSLVSLSSWRRIRSLGIRDSYLRSWSWAQVIDLSAMMMLFGFIAASYAG
jgi:hypothetical protein